VVASIRGSILEQESTQYRAGKEDVMLILDMSRSLLDEILVLVVHEECGKVQATCPMAC
jgi:hypothetical protein